MTVGKEEPSAISIIIILKDKALEPRIQWKFCTKWVWLLSQKKARAEINAHSRNCYALTLFECNHKEFSQFDWWEQEGSPVEWIIFCVSKRLNSFKMMQLGEAERMPSCPTSFIGCPVIWCSCCGRHEGCFLIANTSAVYSHCVIQIRSQQSLCLLMPMSKLGNAGFLPF